MLKFFEAYMTCLEALHSDFDKTITGLPQEALDWVPGKDMNSFCVLFVHSAAVERYWVGEVAGKMPMERDRAAEFQAKGLSEADLKQRMADSMAFIRQYLETVKLEQLEEVRTSRLHGDKEFSVGYGLAHALEHTALHLGHAQMARQLWDQRQ